MPEPNARTQAWNLPLPLINETIKEPSIRRMQSTHLPPRDERCGIGRVAEPTTSPLPEVVTVWPCVCKRLKELDQISLALFAKDRLSSSTSLLIFSFKNLRHF